MGYGEGMCWSRYCTKPGKYLETHEEYESLRSPGAPVERYTSGKAVTRERGYCGIHAPSRVKAREETRKARKAAERLAELQAAAETREEWFPAGFVQAYTPEGERAKAVADGARMTVTDDWVTVVSDSLNLTRTFKNDEQVSEHIDRVRAYLGALRKASSALRARETLSK